VPESPAIPLEDQSPDSTLPSAAGSPAPPSAVPPLHQNTRPITMPWTVMPGDGTPPGPVPMRNTALETRYRERPSPSRRTNRDVPGRRPRRTGRRRGLDRPPATPDCGPCLRQPGSRIGSCDPPCRWQEADDTGWWARAVRFPQKRPATTTRPLALEQDRLTKAFLGSLHGGLKGAVECPRPVQRASSGVLAFSASGCPKPSGDAESAVGG